MRRNHSHQDDPYSAGFVDIFSNTIALLLFFFFVFIIFQFLLNYQLKDRTNKTDKTFEIMHSQNQKLQNEIKNYNNIIMSLEGKLIENNSTLSTSKLTEKDLSEKIVFLHTEISKLNQILYNDKIEMEKRDVEIVELGKQLNRALANKTSELQEYKSEFLESLNKSIKDYKALEKKGDRFVLSGELLFASGSNEINFEGKKELNKVSVVIKELIKKIPPNINWIIRVDGHTDNIPLSKTAQFKNNFDLSYARASAVVNYLITKEIPANKLVPTGFGEYQPLYPNNDSEGRSYNRRIEFQLTTP